MSEQSVTDVIALAMSAGVSGRYGVDVFLDGAVMRHESVIMRPWGVEATDYKQPAMRKTYYPAARVWKVVPIDDQIEDD